LAGGMAADWPVMGLFESLDFAVLNLFAVNQIIEYVILQKM